ncbi:hypothetical protein BT96DRAFT_985593 [Gymnopus androsaceus JB14]|uniref:Non-ribosomal peptide synthetase n=1 Tax=Gymnopus androsaceus JB14 TaxID=1447944 RepID=A0A6A4I9F8_9AGAR|nr:hypothetical protein BT96DRAFT_985593 [Gymnopus androsaceus JB14]
MSSTSGADAAEKGILEHVPSVASTLNVPSLPFSKDVEGKMERNFSEVSTLQVSPSGLNDSGSKETEFKLAPRPAPRPKATRWIRFQLWFNTYRKFFVLVVTLNVIGLVLAAANVWVYPRNYTSAFILGNLQTALLVRNELFGRFLYLVVNTLFAKVSSMRPASSSCAKKKGGIHSGCAASGFMWLVFRVVINFINHSDTHSAILAMGLATNIAVAVSILSAFPWIRNTHHNVFERYHRFVGWFGLLCTWVFVILGDTYDVNTRSWNLNGDHLAKQQDFWFAIMMSFLILWPWLTVRSVKVEVEIPSPKVAVLRFERGMQQGLLARISRSSILEYHAFGIISWSAFREGVNAKCHYLICGVQGDFTKGLVENPPTHIWTRQLKVAGLSNTSTLYKRGIRVCTGTGLGAALSTCIQSPDWYLIWIGSDQEKTFGPTISGLIHNNLEGRVTLWDSKKEGGRPDTAQLIESIYTSWNAEVVFITSNWIGNKEMMEGCKEAGIPAFGTLWDF